MPLREEQTKSPSSDGITWLLVSLLLVIVPYLFHLPFWVSACCLTVLGWQVVVVH